MPSMTLACPSCGDCVDGQERCPDCALWYVVQDPYPPDLPSEEVGPALMTLWKASCDAARGKLPPSALSPPLTATRTQMQQFHEASLPGPLGGAVKQALAALDYIGDFLTTREVAALNEGWALLLPAAATVRDAAGDLGLAEVAPVHSYSDYCFDSVDPFEDPDA